MFVFQAATKNEPVMVQYKNFDFTGFFDTPKASQGEEHYSFVAVVPPTNPLYSKLKAPDLGALCSAQTNSNIFPGQGTKLEAAAQKLYDAADRYQAIMSSRPENPGEDKHPEIRQKIKADFASAKEKFMKNTGLAQSRALQRINDEIAQWADSMITFIRKMNVDEKYAQSNKLQTDIYLIDRARVTDVPQGMYKNGLVDPKVTSMPKITPQEVQKRTAVPAGL